MLPVPAGVVSQPVRRLTFRTMSPAPAYTKPAENATPQGDNATLVALAGPPTPPATVEITPAAAARPVRTSGPPRCGIVCAWPPAPVGALVRTAAAVAEPATAKAHAAAAVSTVSPTVNAPRSAATRPQALETELLIIRVS